MEILGLTEDKFHRMIKEKYNKGNFHSTGIMKYLYHHGSLEGLEKSHWFWQNPPLAKEIQKDWGFHLEEPALGAKQEGTEKFTLNFNPGERVESVVIPMQNYNTLCVSSQLGCARGCAFCRTASMGLKRNLRVHEILAQYMTARFSLGRTIRNIVFMGMGEPLDNFENLMDAIDILTHPWGPNLNKKHISISTCGQVRGLEKLLARMELQLENKYHLLTLAISLNAVKDDLRSQLMPINRQWPLKDVKAILKKLPQSKKKDKLYLEYIIIPEVNNRPEDAYGLVQFMEGIQGRVNLIPLNAPEHSPYRSARREEVEAFWEILRKEGITCYSRKRKGDQILAACGQLATGNSYSSKS